MNGFTGVTVIGAGLAGSEAAWRLAEAGIPVRLIEMKPLKKSPAHSSDSFAELVCSNSLRGDSLSNAVGLLKEELRRLGSLIMACADASRVPGGGALAVDREKFSRLVTEKLKSHPLIDISHQEAVSIPPEGQVVIATGPLTSDAMADTISGLLGGAEYLSFYDAAAPIVEFDGIDMENAYFASRYDKGTPDYVNCPMNKEEYTAFIAELREAREAEVHGFEDKKVFEGCMPVEVMARRGEDTLRYGPLKPVGLRDPRTGRTPYAVVQLRRDNESGSIYNMVGFQTHLKFPEQDRVFRMIPAIKNARFMRYGVMHRNTYIDSPRLLNCHYQLLSSPRILFAGQITGVEGYVESAASGLAAAMTAICAHRGRTPKDFGRETAIGALAHYISDRTVRDFQPMNINFGIMPPLEIKIRGKKEKNIAISERALKIIDEIKIEEV